MSPAIHSEVLYWGLKFSDWISLTGLILGPVVAVSITLWIEGGRKKREQRIQVMRMLIATRHLPADPSYSVAINLIPVEFNDNKRVMAAWNAYIEKVSQKPATGDEEQHKKIVEARQTNLIFGMMKALDFNLSETAIQTSAYASQGYVDREKIVIDSQLAMPKIASALNRQLEILEGNIRTRDQDI